MQISTMAIGIISLCLANQFFDWCGKSRMSKLRFI